MADEPKTLPSPFDENGKIIAPKRIIPPTGLTPEKVQWPPPEGACFHCEHCMPHDEGMKILRHQKFFRKIFHLYGDETDVKPHHVGNPAFYSICKYKNIAVHVSAPGCEFHTKKKLIARIFGGLGK